MSSNPISHFNANNLVNLTPVGSLTMKLGENALEQGLKKLTGESDKSDIGAERCHRGDQDGASAKTGQTHEPSLANLFKALLGRLMGHQQSLPSASSAADTMENLQKTLGIGLLSKNQVKQMKNFGEITTDDGKTIKVPKGVQQAAEKMLEKTGPGPKDNLFGKLEKSTDGQNDDKLGQGDYDMAKLEGKISHHPSAPLPSSSSAFEGMYNFMTKNHVGSLNEEQMKKLAETGMMTVKSADGGDKLVGGPELQAMAKKMLKPGVDGGDSLFSKIESATTGSKDKILVPNDFLSAMKNMLKSATA